MKKNWTIKPLWLACMMACSASAEVFTLGEVMVTAPSPRPALGTAQTVTQDELRLFNGETIGKALSRLPGITGTEGGGRNEQMLNIRGFDLRQVPVFVDGIPVYVSYDGYVDLGRFNTFDLTAINVSKGFSSVLYGPNTLGGAINLISRKPTKSFEGDVTAGVYQNKSMGNNGFHTDVNMGGNQGTWYWQASGSYLNKDHYLLSGNFQPTALENGGVRENSYNRDKKLNFKIGWTPNAGDEYSLNYINQQGAKGTPVYAGKDPATIKAARYWQWPYWDKESLYWVSRTAIGSDSYLKTRIYYDKFQNSIQNFSNNTYTVLGAMPFMQSWYDDYSYGGSMEFGTQWSKNNKLKFAAHLKDDVHREHNLGNPIQNFKDRTTSLGVEDTHHFNDQLKVVAGISYDARDTVQAQNFLAGKLVDFQQGNTSAWNPQLGAFYKLTPNHELHATVSRKSRFPTMKDRYSYRLGTAIPNAALQAERSTNYELGISSALGERVRLNGAVFYHDVQDMIQAVAVTPTTLCAPTAFACTQMQNIGNVRTQGLELGVLAFLSDKVEVGANYTLLNRRNISNPTLMLIDVPLKKFSSYAKWQVSEPMSILGSVEANSWRYSATNATRIAGGFGIANIKVMYQFSQAWSAEAGVNNLLDKNYMMIEGYPLEGRNFFANASFKF